MRSELRTVLPLLILIILALLCLLLARAEAASPEADDESEGRYVANGWLIYTDESLRPIISVCLLNDMGEAGNLYLNDNEELALKVLPSGDTTTSLLYWSPDG